MISNLRTSYYFIFYLDPDVLTGSGSYQTSWIRIRTSAGRDPEDQGGGDHAAHGHAEEVPTEDPH